MAPLFPLFSFTPRQTKSRSTATEWDSREDAGTADLWVVSLQLYRPDLKCVFHSEFVSGLTAALTTAASFCCELYKQKEASIASTVRMSDRVYFQGQNRKWKHQASQPEKFCREKTDWCKIKQQKHNILRCWNENWPDENWPTKN